MNRLFIMGTVWLLCITSTSGQVRFGVQGGVQAATVYSSVDLSSLTTLGKVTIPIGERTGFRGGIMADIPLSANWSVRPQLLYSTKGGNANVVQFATDLITKLGLSGSIDPKQLGNSLNSAVVINYLELPVQITYGLPAGPGKVLIGAGPYIAGATGGTINDKPITFDTGNFNKWDFGAIGSVGYELNMGFSVSAYYSYGLLNYSKRSSLNLASLNPNNVSTLDPSSFGGTLYNRAYGVSIGYLLPSRR
ncbi:PorT family protein [Fibrella sp. HMF5335]|uniref:PorT family protein n=1 Tax=Fibrella rubiginis TaxID=2817060 RepID=A0A939K2C7_9BACT|nr:porin family protein [Fibrella rubiginis]MBO0938077.1 PorT family protein [Fibrella rubiginis]